MLSKLGCKIGSFDFPIPVFPAPMCGVMDKPFREIISQFGCPILYSEMLASYATTIPTKQSYVEKTTFNKISNIPFVIQIAGRDPDIMEYATKIAIQNGADIIDINSGCPVKKVTNGDAGCALMKNPELFAKNLQAVIKVASGKIPVTVKMRLGWDDDNKNFFELGKLAEELGIACITVHGRTRSQMYNGKADWKIVKNLTNFVKIPVIINGDIQNTQDTIEAMEQSGANGVMIGRALYGKPWLIKEIMDNLSYIKSGHNDKFYETKFSELEMWERCISQHLQKIFDFYGSENGIGFAIKHLHFYSKGIEGGAKLRQELSHLKTKDEICKISEEFFSK